MHLDPAQRRKLGIALIVVGLLTIVGAVLAVCQSAEGPGWHTTFAQRRTYDQVKVAVHKSFPLAFVVGLLGLGLAMLGSRISKRRDAS